MPLSLPAHCSPFLPSGDTTETVEENYTEACFVSTKLSSKPADCISPTPNSTQHPIVVAAGWPQVQVTIPTNYSSEYFVTLKGKEVTWVQRTQT